MKDNAFMTSNPVVTGMIKLSREPAKMLRCTKNLKLKETYSVDIPVGFNKDSPATLQNKVFWDLMLNFGRLDEARTDPKPGFSCIVFGNESQILTRFNQPSQLRDEKSYEISLINLDTYNSIPNFHAGINSFRHSSDDGANTIALGTGSYDIKYINDEIQRQLLLNKHKVKIIIDTNLVTLRAKLTLIRHYQVDFNVVNSINTVLGFERQIYTFDMTTDGYTEGEHIVNITSINSILVHSDILHGSDSFFPSDDPGTKIILAPKNLVNLPVTLQTINHMRTYLPDQDGRPIDLRGEHLHIRFHLREV
ncbi:unnamed protein product [Mytilus edulis]|uniref:Uncharacterized protein n=1 Tax=Mytilus edulis TaxID=6550 RepID=A0A8S3SFS5_MYTED|nr:unnamed protein product [Mytilus edulis]